MSDNVVSLDDYRSPPENLEERELDEAIIIGWSTDENGDKMLYVSSSVEDKESLWMIELAKNIIENRPPVNRDIYE